MNDIQVNAICKIHEGKLERFKSVAEQCLQSVRENDSGTLQYDWFLNEDGSECIVRERCRDSAAVLEHMQNLGDKLGELASVSNLTVEVFGTPSAELVEAGKAMGVKVYTPYQGLTTAEGEAM